MRGFPLTSAPPAGGERLYLDTLGVISGLKWSTTFPGGCTTLECNLHLPPEFSHVALMAGRRLAVQIGVDPIWAGKLLAPERGSPWKIRGIGIASMGNDYRITAAASLTAAVDAAISRGLPWTRPAALSTQNVALSARNVTDALAAVGKAEGKGWLVTPSGVVSMITIPTAPTLILQTSRPIMATMSGYYTALVAIYSTGTSTTAKVTVTDTAAIARFGRVEAEIDITSLGTLTSAVATTRAQAILDANKPRLRVTDPIPVAPGQLRTVGGAAVDLATVQAGTVVRLQQGDFGREFLTEPFTPLDLLIGETLYDATTETLTITPVGETRHDLKAALYGAAA